jgi:triacylglycerol esterase/lipase EstA (alpha/beta hydrolase family)
VKIPTLISALILSSVVTQAAPIDFSKYNPQGINVTARYRELMKDPPNVSGSLKNYKIILIQGIMGNYVSMMNAIIMKYFGQYNYFQDQQATLKEWGLDYQKVNLDTEDGVAKNSKEIAKVISNSNKPVLILAHSKGALDALYAMVTYPDLVDRVAGMIAIQPTYMGTPVADFITGQQPWKGLANISLAILGGSGESLNDLMSERRLQWYETNVEKIQSIQRRVPILSFGSWKNDEPNKRDSEFELPRNLMLEKNGVESDGLVPWKSAILPGGHYVSIEASTTPLQSLIQNIFYLIASDLRKPFLPFL